MRLPLALALSASLISPAWAMSQMDLPAGYSSPHEYLGAAFAFLATAWFFAFVGRFFKSPDGVKALTYGVVGMLVLSVQCYALDSDGTEPDPVLTPGAVETQDVDILCHHKTAERRHTTAREKAQAFTAYGLVSKHAGWCAGPNGCSVDHRVPLECGGADVPANLWPETGDGPYNQEDKNRLEGLGRKLVCQGRITPADCQAWFLGDWKAEYDRRFGAIKGQ